MLDFVDPGLIQRKEIGQAAAMVAICGDVSAANFLGWLPSDPEVSSASVSHGLGDTGLLDFMSVPPLEKSPDFHR